MKTPIRLSRILIFGCSVSVLLYVVLNLTQGGRTFTQPVQSEQPTAQQTYVSEVIIEAPWGKENLVYGEEASAPGEFGMHEEFQEPGATEGLIIGPNTFTVAPNGDIYINDPLNRRIQRFGPSGELISVIPIEGGFMCVDKENNVYSARASSPHWFIDKYDQGGNLLASYPIEIERRQIVDIHCDNSGRVFMEFIYSHMEADKGRQVIIDTTWDGICQVTAPSGGLSLEQQRNSIRRDWLVGGNSAALDKSLFLAPDRGLAWGYGNLHMVNLAGDTVRVLEGLRGVPLGCDENLNVYTREIPRDFYAHEYDERKHAPTVRKYNEGGQLISTFRYWCGKPYVGIFKSGLTDAFLDLKGNLYVFCQSHKDGIKVIKWHKSD